MLISSCVQLQCGCVSLSRARPRLCVCVQCECLHECVHAYIRDDHVNKHTSVHCLKEDVCVYVRACAWFIN